MEKLIFKNTIDDFVDATYLYPKKISLLIYLRTFSLGLGIQLSVFSSFYYWLISILFNVCTFYTIIMINRLTLMILSSQIVYIETDKYSTIQIINGND